MPLTTRRNLNREEIEQLVRERDELLELLNARDVPEGRDLPDVIDELLNANRQLTIERDAARAAQAEAEAPTWTLEAADGRAPLEFRSEAAARIAARNLAWSGIEPRVTLDGEPLTLLLGVQAPGEPIRSPAYRVRF